MVVFFATGCEDPIDGPTAVTFSSVISNGNATQTTTEITLTFNAAVTGLNANDIMLTHGVSGQTVTKGTLSGTGPVYTLPISGFTADGELTVAVAKTDFAVNGSPQTVTIHMVESTYRERRWLHLQTQTQILEQLSVQITYL